ncbi:MAG TPA: caspase family protein [Kofleriaceae bacterium]|nr:caspase family protein [Kofleriaceae bacterium]
MKLVCFLLALLAVRAAYADDGVATYAIVVGSNQGGAGQTDLRYAEDDARRVGALLTELGGYQPDQVDIVVHPSPDELRARIAKLADKLAADDKAGRATRVLFYYSGHAKATALDLGSSELPLPELRQKLFELPSKLTVVVLDACQSGAFSRVKGAAPAADFSFNSRQQLDATGVAVLASSSGSELSQESEQLKSSYFTHHLLVGLRGAGDTNGDGQVTVDEAYRYAYHQTLLATAETAVGGQHVSLEVDLKGHGEVPLSYPRAATAHIDLPGTLEGRTLIEDRKSHTVVAETYKAKGAAVRVAVAPGEYRVLVRHGSTLSRCDVSGNGTVDLARCHDEAIVSSTTKGGGWTRPYRIEAQLLVGGERHDAYTDTLQAFGYNEQFLSLSTGISLTGLRRIDKHLWVGGLGSVEGMPAWERPTDGLYSQRLEWNTLAIAGVGRAETAFADSGVLSRIKVYAQLAAGLGIGGTKHRDQDGMITTDTFVGPAGAVGAGVLLGGDDNNVFLKGLGFSLGYSLEYARVIDNLVGDTHASGGHRFTTALSYSF